MVAISIATIGLVTASPASAAAATPPWEPDPSSAGTLSFYDSNGNVITSGKTNVAPFAAYAVGSKDPVAGNSTAGLLFAHPDPSAGSTANYYKEPVGVNNAYPVTATGTPTSISSLPATTPVYVGTTDDETIDTFQSDSNTVTATGYANVVQIRLRTQTPTDVRPSATYDVADLSIDPNTSTWTQVYPTPAAATKPGAPTGVSATPGNASATVSFTAPASNGGATITGYKIEYSSNNGTSYTTATTTATSSPYTVTGLTNGTSYVFRVSATNSAGTGTPSANSSAVTPVAANTAPGAPTGVTATAGNAQATVSWTAPTSTGGSAITGYKVEQSADNGASFTTSTTSTALTGSSTSAVVTGLTNGTAYIFRVSAINSVGTSTPSTSSAAVTPKAPTAPTTAPTNVSAVAGDTQATVTWTAPTNDGGSTITGYKIEQSADNGATFTTSTTSTTPTGSSTSATVTGLVDGTSYVFRVSAINAIGTGPASTNSAAVTPKMVTAPGSPTNVTAFGGNASARIVWNAPANNGGSAITGYKVEQSSDGGANFTTSTTSTTLTGSSTSATVTGLVNGTAYIFRVSAINAVGASAPSTNTASITPFEPISAPSSLDITAPSVVQFGSTATIAVTLTDSESQTGLEGQSVSLYGRHDASQDFGRILTATTSSTGAASATVTPGSYEQWEWKYDGTMNYDASTSPVVATQVQQTVSVKTTATQVNAGQVIVVYGTVNPSGDNEGIYLQVLKGTVWQNAVYSIVKKQTLPDGRNVVSYQIGVRFTQPGAARYRVFKPTADGRLNGTSESFIIGAR